MLRIYQSEALIPNEKEPIPHSRAYLTCSLHGSSCSSTYVDGTVEESVTPAIVLDDAVQYAASLFGYEIKEEPHRHFCLLSSGEQVAQYEEGWGADTAINICANPDKISKTYHCSNASLLNILKLPIGQVIMETLPYSKEDFNLNVELVTADGVYTCTTYNELASHYDDTERMDYFFNEKELYTDDVRSNVILIYDDTESKEWYSMNNKYKWERDWGMATKNVNDLPEYLQYYKEINFYNQFDHDLPLWVHDAHDSIIVVTYADDMLDEHMIDRLTGRGNFLVVFSNKHSLYRAPKYRTYRLTGDRQERSGLCYDFKLEPLAEEPSDYKAWAQPPELGKCFTFVPNRRGEAYKLLIYTYGGRRYWNVRINEMIKVDHSDYFEDWKVYKNPIYAKNYRLMTEEGSDIELPFHYMVPLVPLPDGDALFLILKSTSGRLKEGDFILHRGSLTDFEYICTEYMQVPAHKLNYLYTGDTIKTNAQTHIVSNTDNRHYKNLKKSMEDVDYQRGLDLIFGNDTAWDMRPEDYREYAYQSFQIDTDGNISGLVSRGMNGLFFIPEEEAPHVRSIGIIMGGEMLEKDKNGGTLYMKFTTSSVSSISGDYTFVFDSYKQCRELFKPSPIEEKGKPRIYFQSTVSELLEVGDVYLAYQPWYTRPILCIDDIIANVRDYVKLIDSLLEHHAVARFLIQLKPDSLHDLRSYLVELCYERGSEHFNTYGVYCSEFVTGDRLEPRTTAGYGHHAPQYKKFGPRCYESLKTEMEQFSYYLHSIAVPPEKE